LSDIHYYADAFAKLCTSGLLRVSDPAKQQIVILGHSAGAIGTIFATRLFNFNMMILVDPPIFSPSQKDNMTPMYRIVEQITPQRKAIWKSREDALKYFQARMPWKAWDPRILELYTKYGLRDLPTPFIPDKTGVTLVCSPKDEAAAYSSAWDSINAIEHMNKICSKLPVHLVLGAREDMFFHSVQNSIHEPEVGRVIASFTRVENAGHLVVQENPKGTADAIHSVLNKSAIPKAAL